MPPLAWFRAFEAAARNLSFTGAAGELGLTQSAISQHVRSLERRFGVTLFTRKPRGLALTDDGRRLLPDVSLAISTLADLSLAYDTGRAGTALTVAASVSIAQWYLAPGIASFRAAHPDLPIRLVTATWPDEYHRPVADVEVRFGSAPLVGRHAAALEPNDSIVVAAPGLEIDPANLGAHPLIEPVGTSDTWRQWADHVGYGGELRPQLMVDSHGFAVDLARRGLGIALTSSLIAAPAIGSGSLIRVDLPSKPCVDGYYLAVNDRDNAAAGAFARWLLGEIEKHRSAD
ncbi:MAG: LysR substrate-binding domain-containing protein [Rhodospirillales bacterium]